MNSSATKETAVTDRRTAASSATNELQLEPVTRWRALLSPGEFQTKVESLSADVFPNVDKRMEAFTITFNRTSNQAVDLLGKTIGVYQATSLTDAQTRLQEVLDHSVAALRFNVHTALDTSAKFMTSWKELVVCCVPAIN